MEIRILKKNRNELKLEITGEGHTFCNVVQKALLKNQSTDLAGYNIPHPLMAKPLLYVRTKGRKKAEDILWKAIKEVQKDIETFRSALDKALKDGGSKEISNAQDVSSPPEEEM